MGTTISSQLNRLNNNLMNAIETDCDTIQNCRANISNIEIQINNAKNCTASVTNVCLKDSKANQDIIMKAIQNSFQELELLKKKEFFPKMNKKTNISDQNDMVEEFLLNQCNSEKKPWKKC